MKDVLLTVGVHIFTQFGFGLAVGSVAGLVRQARGHGGRRHHGFEAALPFLHIELRVEDDDVDLGHVQHTEGHRCAQIHRDGQRGGLDVQL